MIAKYIVTNKDSQSLLICTTIKNEIDIRI